MVRFSGLALSETIHNISMSTILLPLIKLNSLILMNSDLAYTNPKKKSKTNKMTQDLIINLRIDASHSNYAIVSS